jgi:steroid delta-isomerase-like uncharacterized protein
MTELPLTTEKKQSLREKRDAVVFEHVHAENRHDVAAAVATFHTPCYRVMPMGIVHDGEQAVGELLSGIFKGFPDFTVDIDKTYHSEDAVVLEMKMKGTHLGDWAGLKATGRSMDVPIVCIFEFEGDRLTCEKVYFDMATLVNQLNPSAGQQ